MQRKSGEGLEIRVSDELESNWALGVTGRMGLEIQGREASPVVGISELSSEHSFHRRRLPRSLGGGSQGHPRMLPP